MTLRLTASRLIHTKFTAMMMMIAPNSHLHQEGAQGEEEEEAGGRRKGSRIFRRRTLCRETVRREKNVSFG